MRFSTFAVMLLAGALSGCAGGYGALCSFDKTGYEDKRLGADLWLVRYQGDRNIRNERLNDYAWLRAADLCLKNGYSAFLVVTRQHNDGAEFSIDEVAPPSRPEGGRKIELVSSDPSCEIIVRFFCEPAPANSLNAEKTAAAIRQKYSL